MIISPLKTSYQQGRLFPEPIGNHGHVRYVLGNLAERLTAKLLGGNLHKDATGYYCPDVSVSFKCPDVPDWFVDAYKSAGLIEQDYQPRQMTKSIYLEVKASGKSGQTFVYSGRLEKDLDLTMEGHILWYAIWQHGVDTKQAETVQDLQDLFLCNLRAFYLVPFEVIYILAQQAGEVPLNGSYGKHSAEKIYNSGYRITMSKLANWKLIDFQSPCVHQCWRV